MINHRVPPFGPAPSIDMHEILGSTVAGDSGSASPVILIHFPSGQITVYDHSHPLRRVRGVHSFRQHEGQFTPLLASPYVVPDGRGTCGPCSAWWAVGGRCEYLDRTRRISGCPELAGQSGEGVHGKHAKNLAAPMWLRRHGFIEGPSQNPTSCDAIRLTSNAKLGRGFH
jgi:hypothetical protein